MRIHRDERGQTILLVAFSLPILIGFIGIATDVGALFKDKRTLQTAADAAAIAGALNLNYGTTAIQTAARNAATSNGFTDGSAGVTVTVPPTPQWPGSTYVGKPGYTEVTITKVEPTIFLALFGRPSVSVLARAVAALGGPAAACIYTTGQSSTGLSVSDATVTAPQCGLVIDSNTSPPMSVVSSGGPTAITMKRIGTVGDCGGNCGTGISPNPVSGIIPYSDPLSYLPQFTCNTSSCTNGTTTIPCLVDPNVSTSGRFTLDPACYNGLSISGTGLIFFNPGTYVINGPINFTGSNILTGTGVTFYINSGAINIDNFTTLNFYAPNAPGTPYNGILFAQSPASPNSTQTFNIVAGSVLSGIMYFPGAQLTLTTTNVSATVSATFVAQSLSINGGATPGNLTLDDYSSVPGVTSPLSSAVLVE